VLVAEYRNIYKIYKILNEFILTLMTCNVVFLIINVYIK
jgi:hypothetical protein